MFLGYAECAETKFTKNRFQSGCIVRSISVPDIDIPGVPWMPIGSQRIATNHEVFNPVCV